jgi:hypothetical protein
MPTYTDTDLSTYAPGVSSYWNTVLGEYNNPQWFQDIIYSPLAHEFKGTNVKYQFRDSDRMLRGDFGPWFQAFDVRDWDVLDEQFAMRSEHLDQQTDFVVQRSGEVAELDERIYSAKRDTEIDEAELDFDRTMSREELNKQKIRLDALKTITQLDSLIATTGLSSGGLNEKKQIQMDVVEADLQQANMSRLIASKELDKRKDRAIDEFIDTMNTENLKRDVQYDTVMLTNKQKKEAANIELVTDKLNIYDRWKSSQVSTLGRIAAEKEYSPSEAAEAWSHGGVEFEAMRGYYEDFANNDWKRWKEDNPDLYAEMLENPEDYGISTQTSRMGAPSGGYFQADLQYTPSEGISGYELDLWKESQPGGLEYRDLTDDQIDVAIMNQIFLQQGSRDFREEYSGSKLWYEEGDSYLNPYDILLSVNADMGYIKFDEMGNPIGDINPYDMGIFLNPYNYNGIVDDGTQGMGSTINYEQYRWAVLGEGGGHYGCEQGTFRVDGWGHSGEDTRCISVYDSTYIDALETEGSFWKTTFARDIYDLGDVEVNYEFGDPTSVDYYCNEDEIGCWGDCSTNPNGPGCEYSQYTHLECNGKDWQNPACSYESPTPYQCQQNPNRPGC